MLRLVVLLLVLANVGYFAWSHGALASMGMMPAVQTEPQRLAAQIRPEAIRILTPQEARDIENRSPGRANGEAGASAAADNPTECLQAGLFNEEQTTRLRAILETSLPPGSWQFESSVEPARWIVYMGKYNNEETLAKKRSELRQLGVSFRAVSNDALSPGLALGSFQTESEAEKELTRMANKGVRTARVVQERAEARGQILKFAAVDSGAKTQLDALKAQFEGKTLRSCS